MVVVALVDNKQRENATNGEASKRDIHERSRLARSFSLVDIFCLIVVRNFVSVSGTTHQHSNSSEGLNQARNDEFQCTAHC